MDKKKKPETTWGKIWYFIWEDDSALSWIVNIVLAFILIKFVIYPGLGLLLGTSHPVVAVVSGSMEHKTTHPCLRQETYDNGVKVCVEYDKEHYEICGSMFDEKVKVTLDKFWVICGSFYTDYNITQSDFETYSFKNGFNTGDIIVLVGKKPEKIEIGDVIVFMSHQKDPIIHRVINKAYDDDYHFRTKGDHNKASYVFESNIKQDQIIGKAVFRIPFLGNIKIWFVELLNILGLDKTIGKLFN